MPRLNLVVCPFDYLHEFLLNSVAPVGKTGDEERIDAALFVLQANFIPLSWQTFSPLIKKSPAFFSSVIFEEDTCI